MTMPSTYVYICEQQCVHKRLQRNMRLNLATVGIFRIFTVLEQLSFTVNKGYEYTKTPFGQIRNDDG